MVHFKIISLLLLCFVSTVAAETFPTEPYVVPNTAKGKLAAIAVPFTVKAWIKTVTFDQRDQMSLFLQAGMDINAIEQKHQESALSIALSKNSPDLLAWLLQRGADLQQLSNYKPDAIARAISLSSPPLINQLMANGIDINSTNSRGETAVHLAVNNGQLHRLRQLISLGAAVNSVNLRGQMPLILAVKYGHTSIVEFLLQQGAEVNLVTTDKNQRLTPSALQAAASRGSTYIAQLLLQAGGDISYPTLVAATRQHHLDILELLLENLKTSDSYYTSKQSIVDFAFSQNRQDAVLLTLKYLDKLKLSSNQISTLLHSVVESDDPALLKLLMSHDNSDIDPTHLIMIAIRSNRLETLNTLLTQLSISASQQNTLLMNVVSKGFCSTLPVLLHHDLTAIDIVVIQATISGHPKCVQALLAAGALQEIEDVNGNTLLLIATERGYISIIKLLLAAGADRSRQNNQGQTAMSIAKQKNYLVAMDILR